VRIVDALEARNRLTPAYDPASEAERQARRERQAAAHARAVISLMDEVPRKQLLFSRHWIEDTSTGHFYRPFGGDPQLCGPDVTKYYVSQDGLVITLERCTNPSSRTELEQMQARKQQRRLEQEAAAKERRAQLRAAAR